MDKLNLGKVFVPVQVWRLLGMYTQEDMFYLEQESFPVVACYLVGKCSQVDK